MVTNGKKLLETGKVKSIGVSNFSIKTLSLVLGNCTVVPAVNQVELHPCLPQEELKTFCEYKGILITAYTPLGRSTTLLEDSIIRGIAQRRDITPAHVLLSWGIQRSTIVIPKSENEQRMKASLQVAPLLPEDFEADDGSVFGWTYEQMGWNMTRGGVVKSSARRMPNNCTNTLHVEIHS